MRNFSLELLNALILCFSLQHPLNENINTYLGAPENFQSGDMFNLVMVRGNEMESAKTKCADSFSLSFAD